MSEILHANIFFFITSGAVILVTVFLAWGLYYVVRILKNVQDITERVDQETIELGADIKALRATIKQEGFKLVTLYTFFQKMLKPFLPKKKKKAVHTIASEK